MPRPTVYIALVPYVCTHRHAPYLGCVGKEYAKADSRYATRDPFTISMEAVTAFVEGPLCFLILWGMARQAPWRYTVQFAVSLGQLYGDVLYFATAVMEGMSSGYHAAWGCFGSCSQGCNQGRIVGLIGRSKVDYGSC
jgi:EXPERA (EXPanded EBP superfamily)